MGNLTVDPLAIGALVGFASLVAISLGITLWLIKQSRKSAGEK
ncbi:hypothetical protein [Hyphomonas pacifica]|uniref:Uncharacterized protein n=1 Tax=Hyphomonas pacifica TaxID=1280941 RepID=A0A062TYJ2_9PROT|nr:hypothetical protein [Hyphomonas pacifica]KCZ47267.1 hypothetical protein HY2_16615 [Hyphomonas pacifica]RAN31067.1 hypothetical protein HY3_16990 [Hyphomonas pacifica]RAN36502.1 hypothetical protein HY11_01910 [Hyphomonas pacifica]|tara:strand:- start:902 stop:1030 length:129 start_codon:yes stop_codon:yes gene_type:complete